MCKKRQINKMFCDIVKQYKKDYSVELENFKKKRSEIIRLNRINKNFIYRYYVWILSVLVALIIIVSQLGIFFPRYNTYFLALNLVLTFILFAMIYADIKRIDSEQDRNNELKEMRYRIWKRAVDNVARKNNYSSEEYSKYLLEYHSNGLFRKLICIIVSMTCTVVITYCSKDISINNIETFIIMCISNIVLNVLGDILQMPFSQNYYFTSLKNDYLLTTHK